MLRWKTDIIKELQAEACGSVKGTEEQLQDLEKIGKINGGKSVIFNLNDTAIL